MRRAWRIFGLLVLLMAGACSTTKHVPEGKYLLDDVRISVNDSIKTLKSQDMMAFVRQRPNNRMLHMSRFRLGLYNLSGNDSSKWWNKWMRKLGEAPVIFDRAAMQTDSSQLLRAMQNSGFMDARVSIDSLPNARKRTIRLRYNLDAGEPHIIRSIAYEFPNDTLRALVMRDSAHFAVKPGDRLDRGTLDLLREGITQRMRNRGYWAFSKEFITFNADTTEGSKLVDLTMKLNPQYDQKALRDTIDTHRRYIIRHITYITDYDPEFTANLRDYPATDSINYRGVSIIYGDKRYLRPSVLYDNCLMKCGSQFRQRDLDNTYESLGRLPILKFTQIRVLPAGSVGDTGILDVYILLRPERSQSIALELEGTNSEGDLGVAASVNYTHTNAFRGSETLNLKLRGSYEALNGHLEGFIHDRFMEYSLQGALLFPNFKFPFLRDDFKRRIKAQTQLDLSISYQERPEFTRIISTAGWSYHWARRNNRYRYVLTPIDINYVYLPASTNDFLDKIAPDNPLLRYSYEDHFIMRLGFNFYYTNKHRPTPFSTHSQKDIVTIRMQSETAGNLLFGITSAIDPHRHFHRNPYEVFGINYAQYVRFDGDVSYLHTFSRRHSLACYFGLGVGVPYGNSTILPFEKRFYGGGANGVRGWSVRTLGPGRMRATNTVSDFIFQCGDIRLNLSMEYRVKLFWVLEGGLFVDAGNIWTIRDYKSQPMGEFRFDSFYKELAASYGVGLRMDFNYFLLRFDLGMKARNPAFGAEPWPILHPRWRRDHAFHFSIGYPF